MTEHADDVVAITDTGHHRRRWRERRHCATSHGNGQCTHLADLEPGQRGTIVGVGAKGDTARRLMEMGVVRGEVVRVVKCAPFGDPMELELEGYHLSLRKLDAQTILVQVV